MRFLNQLIALPGGIYLLLFLAALLEVWGDSYFQSALHRSSGLSRWVFVAAGVAVLSLYGFTVNLSKWDFGTLLGIYVFFFFAAAQLVNWVRFKQAPSLPIYLGGLLMAAGAAVIRFWKV